MITVCARTRDTKSKSVPKYTNARGTVVQTMPIRELSPDVTKLVPLAAFLYENMDNCYVGGFLSKPNAVIVKGKIGSQYSIDVAKKGIDATENMYKCYGLSKDDRASCEWLFSIIEPNQTDEEYLNAEAAKIATLAGNCGQVVCRRTTGDIFARTVVEHTYNT